jgi:hypothetical protein
LSPAATRYCLPPVRTIANMALITFQMHMPARAGPAGEGVSLRAAADSVNRKAAIQVVVQVVALQQQHPTI